MRTKYLRNSVFLLIISILLSLAVSEIIMRKILPRPYIKEFCLSGIHIFMMALLQLFSNPVCTMRRKTNM